MTVSNHPATMAKPLLISVALALAFPFSAGIADIPDGSGTLDLPTETVAIPGRAYAVEDVPVPYTFDLTVALPSGYWNDHDGGVEIALRWESEYNLFDLYVLNLDDQLIASATGFPTSAQSLILDEATNGVYHIVVVPQVQVPDSFTGLAQVELKPAGTGARKPDLVPLAPSNFKIATGAYSFLAVENSAMSCYIDEVVDLGVQRCLRFDSAVANLGEGPFELWLDTLTMASEEQTVYQDLFDRDGKPVGTPLDVGTYTFHATHGHMHYQNFATYSLYTVVNGQPGTLIGASRKADFCMIDTRLLWFGEPRGNGARNHHFPNCNVPGSETNTGTTIMRQGIDVGWADVYTWDLPGQFIDITGIAPGDYAVVVDVNPGGYLDELELANNRSFAIVSIPPA